MFLLKMNYLQEKACNSTKTRTLQLYWLLEMV